MSWGATVEKLKFSIHVHPECHTNHWDRLLEVTKAGCGTKHGQQTSAAFSSTVNRSEQQPNIWDSVLTFAGVQGPLCTAASLTAPISSAPAQHISLWDSCAPLGASQMKNPRDSPHSPPAESLQGDHSPSQPPVLTLIAGDTSPAGRAFAAAALAVAAAPVQTILTPQAAVLAKRVTQAHWQQKKHTGLSEQPGKNACTSSHLRLGCKHGRFGTKWALLNFPLLISDSKYRESWVLSWNIPP